MQYSKIRKQVPQFIVCVVCVLTGLRTEQYDQIMRWWDSKPQSGISQVLDSAAYWYVILPRRSCYYSPCRSYHTSSSAYLGVPGLSPGIYAYHTRSFAHLCVSCLCTIITTSYPATPPPSRSYYVTLSPNCLLLLASCETPAMATRSCSDVASWRHQASLLCPPFL